MEIFFVAWNKISDLDRETFMILLSLDINKPLSKNFNEKDKEIYRL